MELEFSWLAELDPPDVVAAAASAVIAIFTVLLVVTQIFQFCHDKKVQRANYLLALHQHRVPVYQALTEVAGAYFIYGRPPTADELNIISAATGPAQFLFPYEVDIFIAEIRFNALKYAEWELRLTDKDERAPKQLMEIRKWFDENLTHARLREVFEPHLKVPDCL